MMISFYPDSFEARWRLSCSEVMQCVFGYLEQCVFHGVGLPSVSCQNVGYDTGVLFVLSRFLLNIIRYQSFINPWSALTLQ